jgi:hypothetical protein
MIIDDVSCRESVVTVFFVRSHPSSMSVSSTTIRVWVPLLLKWERDSSTDKHGSFCCPHITSSLPPVAVYIVAAENPSRNRYSVCSAVYCTVSVPNKEFFLSGPFGMEEAKGNVFIFTTTLRE